MRIFAATMAVVWIAVGIYAVYYGINEGPWYLIVAGIIATMYGILWAHTSYVGRHGRIPLWP